MSKENTVSVHVEVVIDGMKAGGARTRFGKWRRRPGRKRMGINPLEIIFPESTGNTLVITDNGQNYIEASGQDTTQQAGLVSAKVFSGTTLPGNLNTVPNDAIVVNPEADGSWYFNQANGTYLPITVCGSLLGGANNNILVVWYHFTGNPPLTYESTPFYAYCPSPLVLPPISVGDHRLPAVLQATFTGALEKLGTVRLSWNGATWVGKASRCDGTLLILLWTGSTFQLTAAGPGSAFTITGSATFSPFYWSQEGRATGALAGPFTVVLKE
jgi:hypothetical protein